MKHLIFIMMLIFSIVSSAQEMNFVSYNIRYNTPNDGINSWPNRISMVTGLLRFHEAEVIGLQEALIKQIKDIQKQMPYLKLIGVGRDDGKEAGEFSPILYDSTKFKLVEHGWFWLSETPEKPGWGWDAKYNRICTWAKLKHNKGKEFLVLNTHFDHQGDIAREESAKLILSKIDEIKKKKKIPVILMGDFNLTPEKAPIKHILQTLKDSHVLSEQPPYGPKGTFNGFDFNSTLQERIDYIFVNEKVNIKKYAVLSDSKDKRYPSDHLPVFVKLSIK